MKLLKGFLNLWLLTVLAAPSQAAEGARSVKVKVVPPEARFSVRQIQGGQVPGGPELNALLPSGSSFPAGVRDGQRGIVVTIHQPGYADFEHAYPLLAKKEFWSEGAAGWEIPIELAPAAPLTILTHQFRFHPAFPTGILAALALALVALARVLKNRNQRAAASADERELESRVAQTAVEDFRGQFDPQPGQVVGDYRVVRKFGEGSFSNIYLVDHSKSSKQYAMKLLKEGAGDEHVVQRIGREYEVGRTLQHPNLVRLADFGQLGGAPYLIMDYIQGEDLSRVLARRRLPLAQSLGLFYQMCDAIAYAHSHGIIHRDLKPENMILTPDGQVRILDLGLAKRVFSGPGQGKLTRTGDVLGTPSYMAPEQVMGFPELRSDIYSLGVILFELASGRLPFNDSDDVMKTLSNQLCMEAPKLSQVAQVPLALEALCSAMLEKEPDARIQTVQEVLQRLEQCYPAAAEEPRELSPSFFSIAENLLVVVKS